MANKDLNFAAEELDRISYQVKTLFGNLTAEQINYKPDAESWSIGQCFEHLILSNNGMLKSIIKAAETSNSFWEKWSPLSSFFGNYLISYNKNDAKKIKAPSKKIVPPSKVDGQIIKNFAANQQKIVEELKLLKKVDWGKTVVTSPFLSVITYKLSDGVKILIEHEKRHIRQAERILKSKKFSAK